MGGAGDENMFALGRDEEEDGMLLEPPDPMDLLIASTEAETAGRKQRPLDFVRAKMADLKRENKQLKARITDLEQTLSIVQTAQEWTLQGMTQEQVDKMNDIKNLLEQGKKAREELQNFSGASRATLYERLRSAKLALKKEREDKRVMKERLVQAFDHAKRIKEQHRRLQDKHQDDHQKFQDLLRDSRDRHRRELLRLRGDGAVAESDRHEQLSRFGENVMHDLSRLQQHLQEVRKETVDRVAVPEDGEEDITGGLPSDSPPVGLGSDDDLLPPSGVGGTGVVEEF